MVNKDMINNSSVDDTVTRIPCSYRLWFLLENTSSDTRYIDVYKDAVNAATGLDRGRVIVVDHDRIVDSLRSDVECAVEADDDVYRAAREHAKVVLHADGRIPASLMVELAYFSIVEALQQSACNNGRHNVTDKNRKYHRTYPSSAEVMTHQHHVVLTNFFDVELLTEFLGVRGPLQRVDSIVRLSCDEISRIRDKFVTKACLAKRVARDKQIRRFWRDFHDELNTESSASAFNDVVVYAYKSKYDARFEPPDPRLIIVTSREFVVREMDRVQDFLSDARTEYDQFVEKLNVTATYDFPTVNDDELGRLYQLYDERLSEYPEEVTTVPVILDAMIVAISPLLLTNDQTSVVDVYFDEFRDESGDGYAYNSICVPYGNECELVVQKHGALRFTDYTAATAKVLTARWRRLLWGSRPLLSLEEEAEYNATISDMKRICVSDCDVDVQLCVLALNRLQINLDVFRGETIGLSGLGMTKVMFAPEFIEPLGCTTMVQILEKQSETRMRMSYAYFEPEDVILVGFYDFQDVTWTRQLSFDFVIPQRPVHAKDHFDLFRNKRTPKFVYAVSDPCVAAYSEKTEEIRFCEGDYLTVARRRWRFKMDTICLIYKSKTYEIIRHVTNDVERVRINTNAGCTYSFDKRKGNVIEFVAYDGTCVTEINSDRNRTDVVINCLQPTKQSKELSRICRRYGNGCVDVEFENGSRIVTYWASGKVVWASSSSSSDKGNNEITATYKNHGNNTKNRPAVSSLSRSLTQISTTVPRLTSNFGTSQHSSAVLSQSSSRPGTYNSAEMKWQTSINYMKSVVKESSSTRNESLVDDDFVISHCSDDGTRWTVEFEDGTGIITYVHEVSAAKFGLSADWVSFDVSKRVYTHPDYREVVKHRDGTIYVRDLVHRLQNGDLELQLVQMFRVEATAASVTVYRDERDAVPLQGRPVDVGLKIATFPWVAGAEMLFEKLDYDRRLIRCGKNTAITAVPSLRPTNPPSAPVYFIVKRNMSGFGLIDRDRYDEFIERIRDLAHTIIHETRDEIVTIHNSDLQLGYITDSKKNSSFMGPAVLFRLLADRDNGWFNRFSSNITGKFVGNIVPKRLISRTFNKFGTDYEQVLKALRKSLEIPSVRRGKETAKLVVRVNVPDLDHVKVLYMTGIRNFRYKDPVYGDDDNIHNFIRRLLNSTVVRLSVKLATLRKTRKNALEAKTRLKLNRFIPYFRRDSYGPFRFLMA